ncbi:MAG: tetratricopeptide repeat protein [Bacteroidota bacterium]
MNEQLFQQAGEHHEKGDFLVALPLWRQLLENIDEGNLDARYTYLFHLGECYSELEETDLAIATFEEALAVGNQIDEPFLYIIKAELAFSYFRKGLAPKAISLFEQALKNANTDYQSYILAHLGDIYLSSDFQKAIDCWTEGLKVATTSNHAENTWIILEKLLPELDFRNLHSRAIEHAENAITTLEETPFILELRVNLALCYERNHQLEKASQQLAKMALDLTIWADLEDIWEYEMELQHLKGTVLLKRKKCQEAEAHFQKALFIAKQNNPAAYYSLQYDIGVVYLLVDNFRKAEDYLQAAIQSAEKNDDEGVLMPAKGQLAALYYTTGRYQKSIELHEEIMVIERAEENWTALCATLNNCAAAYQQIGALKKAKSLLSESGQLAQKIGPKEQLLHLRNQSGLVSLWGDYEQSLSYLQEAVELIQREHLPEEYPIIQRELGITYYTLGIYEKALAYLLPLEQNELFMQLPSQAFSIFNIIGIIYSEMKKITNAERYMQKAMEIAKTTTNMEFELPTSCANLGVLYFNQKNYAAAEPLFLEAARLDEELSQSHQLATDYHNVGLLFHDQKRYAEALIHFEKSISILETLHQQGLTEEQTLFLDQEYHTYELYINTLVHLGANEKALQALERFRSQKLKGSPKDDFLTKKMTFSYLQNQLPNKAGLLIICNSGINEITLFAITKQKVITINQPLITFFSENYPGQNKKLSASQSWQKQREIHLRQRLVNVAFRQNEQRTILAQKLESAIHYYRQRLQRNPQFWTARKIANDQRIAKFLYQLIFQPFQEIFRACKQLYIVPDDLFSYLPFETLQSGENTLLQFFNIQYLPSVSFLEKSKIRQPQPIYPKLLGLGVKNYQLSQEEDYAIPKTINWQKLKDWKVTGKDIVRFYRQLGISHWADLPNSEKEVFGLSQIPNFTAKVLTQQDLSQDFFHQHSFSQYDILHFAVHGVSLPIFSEFSALVFCHHQRNICWTLSEIEQQTLNSYLTFLSACETGLGQHYRGDYLKSLSNAFLKAGSRFVISTLWSVHDEQTKLFVTAFYQQLLKYPAPQALAETKRKCLAGEYGSELRKGVYWGAFVISGC